MNGVDNMPHILVRNLREEVIERLKKRTREGGRSLQSEVKLILEQAVFEPRVDMETARKVCEKFRQKFKGSKFPDTVELIREDRRQCL